MGGYMDGTDPRETLERVEQPPGPVPVELEIEMVGLS